MSRPWYKTHDMPPPYTVNVRVMWDGREFVARRGRHPQTGKDVWAAVKAGGQLELITRIDDSVEPSLWQPLFPDKWAGALPEPVTLSKSRIMTAETMRFGAVDEASSEELAREMHNDREAARAAHVNHVVFHEKQPRQWWFDASDIKYQPMGSVTRRNCEARVMRALNFCGASKGFGMPVTPTAKALADLAEALACALAMGISDDEDIAHRLKPLPADLEDFLIAMGWFSALSPREFWKSDRKAWALNRAQKVMLARSLPSPPTFADLGHEYHVGDAAATERMYDRSISQCLAAANGKRVHDVSVVDQVAALQERNRAYRRAI